MMFAKVLTKKLMLAVAVSVVLGCSTTHTHTIYLNGGTTIDTSGEPSFDDETGFFSFEDLSGREGVIDQNQVLRVDEM